MSPVSRRGRWLKNHVASSTAVVPRSGRAKWYAPRSFPASCSHQAANRLSLIVTPSVAFRTTKSCPAGIADRDEPIVEVLPLELRNERPHRGNHGRGITQRLTGRQCLPQQRVIDPHMGEPAQ